VHSNYLQPSLDSNNFQEASPQEYENHSPFNPLQEINSDSERLNNCPVHSNYLQPSLDSNNFQETNPQEYENHSPFNPMQEINSDSERLNNCPVHGNYLQPSLDSTNFQETNPHDGSYIYENQSLEEEFKSNHLCIPLEKARQLPVDILLHSIIYPLLPEDLREQLKMPVNDSGEMTVSDSDSIGLHLQGDMEEEI